MSSDRPDEMRACVREWMASKEKNKVNIDFFVFVFV